MGTTSAPAMMDGSRTPRWPRTEATNADPENREIQRWMHVVTPERRDHLPEGHPSFEDAGGLVEPEPPWHDEPLGEPGQARRNRREGTGRHIDCTTARVRGAHRETCHLGRAERNARRAYRADGREGHRSGGVTDGENEAGLEHHGEADQDDRRPLDPMAQRCATSTLAIPSMAMAAM